MSLASVSLAARHRFALPSGTTLPGLDLPRLRFVTDLDVAPGKPTPLAVPKPVRAIANNRIEADHGRLKHPL
jgi:hypothetical protein